MRGTRLASLASLVMCSAMVGGAWAKAKKPEPATEAEPEKKGERPRIDVATCPIEDLAVLDGAKVVKFVEARCRTLRLPDGSAATEIGDDEMLVALCTRRDPAGGGRVAISPGACGLEASVDADGKTLKLGSDGEHALSLRTAKVARDARLESGATCALTATGAEQSYRATLAFRRTFEGYGSGKALWFPLPMLTTDFSAKPDGYRLGITPLAVGLGGKWSPASGSRGYVGLSAFGAWNLLVPNDTQTLSNGTTVRINYKSLGGGVLVDASGYLGVGVGIGRTLTSDARTDFRMWFMLGPRLLTALGDL